jgi:hypothetical protein
VSLHESLLSTIRAGGPRETRVDRPSVHPLLSALLLAAGVVAAQAAAPVVLAVVVPVAVGTGLLVAALRLTADGHDAGTRRWLGHVTLWAAAAHLGVGLVIASSESLVGIFGGDATTYHNGARALVDHWVLGRPFPDVIGTGKEGFYYGLAGLYWLLGPHRVAGLAINAAFAGALVPLVADTSRRLFGPAAVRPAALMVAFLPGFLIWTSQLLREAPILACLAVIANVSVRLTERTRPAPLVVMSLTLATVFTLRANVALLVAAGVLAGLAVGSRRGLAGVATGGASVGLVAVFVLAAGIGAAGFRLAASSDLEDVNLARQDLAASESGFARGQDVSTGRSAAAFLPVALLNVGLGPFPWQVGNARQVGGLFEAMSLWLLLPSLWRGWRASGALIGRARLVPVLPAALVALSLALLIGNYGTIVRQRLQVTVFLIPFAALGWSLRRGTTPDTPPPSASIHPPNVTVG